MSQNPDGCPRESNLQHELTQLLQERKEAIQGNMAFSFGYDPTVADIDRQIAILMARIWDSEHHKPETCFERRVAVYDEASGESETFEVSTGPGGEGDGCTIVNRAAAMSYVLQSCSIGDETSLGIVISTVRVVTPPPPSGRVTAR